ncbi:MAG TPA: phospholipase [Microbacterium sp.]|nr:phospholipase [Microbacterium sp.]
MLHAQDSRRARRAARTRRTRTIGTVVAISLLAVAGLGATAPAFAVQTAATPGTAAVAVIGPDAETLHEISDDAQSSLDAARDALTVAARVTADIAAAGLDVGVPDTTIDTAHLRDGIDRLSAFDIMPALLLSGITADTVSETRQVLAHAERLRDGLAAAEAQKAAEEAAAQAAAEAAAQAQRDAEAAAAAAVALANANTPEGAQATARQLASGSYGWGEGEFSCLMSLWTKESGWNYQAYNDSSGATGIPQALPGSKMASAGSDWQTNATTQIAWGLDYISAVYGSPCSAWGHSQATDWY